MEERNRKASDVAGKIVWGELVFVETFPREDIVTVNKKVSNLLGVEPKISVVNRVDESESDNGFLWQLTDLEVAFRAVLEVSDAPPNKCGGSHELFKSMIRSIEAESLYSEGVAILPVGGSCNIESDGSLRIRQCRQGHQMRKGPNKAFSGVTQRT